MKRKLIWLFCLLVLFVSSYYREVLFTSINAIMDGQDFFYAKTTTIPSLINWSYSELNRLKYFLTVTFSIWFMAISLIGLRKGFTSNVPFGFLAGLYLLITMIATTVILVGLSFLEFQTVYPLLRKMIGIIHNPLPFLLISIGFYAYMQIQKSD